MEFNEALDNALEKAAVRVADIDKRKRDAVADFHRQTAPFVANGEKRMRSINALIANEIQPLLTKLQGYKIRDMEAADCISKLADVKNKPGELAGYIASCKAVGWDNIRQTVYPDLVDQGKFDALVRDFRSRLVFMGDVEGGARRTIERLKSRIVYLAETGIVASDVPVFVLQTEPMSPEVFDGLE